MANPAWKTASEVADGYTTLNQTTLKKYQGHEMDALVRELEKLVRETRSQVVAQDDVEATQTKNRRLLRLSQTMTVIQSYRVRARV